MVTLCWESMSHDGRLPVAIIGAGVAGLSCAAVIANAADCPVVHLIDQGSRGRGGRASSSRPTTTTTRDPAMVFDHGCQFFTAESPEFRETCAKLERSGHIARWHGRFGSFDASTGTLREKSNNTRDGDVDFFGLLASDEVYVGVPTMRGLCDGLRTLIRDETVVDMPQCAVTKLARFQGDPDANKKHPENTTPNTATHRREPPARWLATGVDGRRLDENHVGSTERVLGEFNAVVATDVMLAKTGTPGSCSIMGDLGDEAEGAERDSDAFCGEFANVKSTWRAMAAVAPSSLFSLMLAIDSPDDIPFDAVVVTGSEIIQLLVRDSGKPGREGYFAGDDARGTLWTAVSTKQYAASVVAELPLSVDGAYNPQTEAYLANVTPVMEKETIRVLTDASLSKMKPARVTHARTQRWGHAFPDAGWGNGGGDTKSFAWDPVCYFGACGDFALGPGVENAWVSGNKAGAAIAATLLARGEKG